MACDQNTTQAAEAGYRSLGHTKFNGGKSGWQEWWQDLYTRVCATSVQKDLGPEVERVRRSLVKIPMTILICQHGSSVGKNDGEATTTLLISVHDVRQAEQGMALHRVWVMTCAEGLVIGEGLNSIKSHHQFLLKREYYDLQCRHRAYI